MNEPIFGIDLGTTNSCIAVMEGGQPRVITIDGQPTVPSVVNLNPSTGEIIVGVRARNRLALDPASTISSIKRRMGETETVTIHNREMLPEEIAAEILRYLKAEAGKALGREVNRVVITVPAYFEDAQRRATIRAGELAGLDVVRIINEPTAASLVYEYVDPRQVSAAAGDGPKGTGENDHGPEQTLLVYDLGGGTFDVSVVKLNGDVYEVCASCGDTHLGGDDFDKLMQQHLLEHIQSNGEHSLGDDARAMARLLDASERAKVALSSKPFAEIMEEALAPSVDLHHELARQTFERLIEDKLEQTVADVERALHEADMKADQIDRVVLIGGSTRIPRVLELLEEKLGRPVEHSLDPDLGVAMGAAIQGAVLAGEAFNRILIDVSAHSLGVRATEHVEHDAFSAIIPRNTQVPVTRSEVFFTAYDHQERAEVAVFQGEADLCSDNTEIGSFVFELRPAPEASEIVIELSYDLEGIIHVVVDQRGAGNRQEVTMSSRKQGTPEFVEGAHEGADNFIIRRARKLTEQLPPGEFAERISSAATSYAETLAIDECEAAELDRLEDQLLELIEQAEERIEDGSET